MRKSFIGASRRAVLVVRALAASGLLLWAHPSSAALQVGSPFTLADAKTTKFEHSIAGNEHGFVLSWSAITSLFAQKLQTDGSLSGPPLILAAPAGEPSSQPKPGGREWIEVGPPAVSASDREFLVLFDRVHTGLLPPGTTLTLPPKLHLRLIDDNGVHDSPFSVVTSDLATEAEYGMTSKAGGGFVLLRGLVKLGSEPARLMLSRSGEPGTVELPSPETVATFPSLPLVGVASDGQTALVAHRATSGVPPTFLRVTADGTITELTLPGISTSMRGTRLAPFASSHLVAWHEAGALFALRVDASGKALDPAPIALGGSTTSAETLLDVEPGPGSWLVLSASTQGGARLLRMRRLSFDGTLLDPEGLDLELGVGGDLAYADGDHWLLTTHEDLDGTERIMGRFVGEGTLPEPPNNVPLPPQSGAPRPLDAGPSSPITGTSDAGATGGAAGTSDAGATGGALPGAVDAGGGVPASSDGGCGCRVVTPDRGNGLWASAVALALLARRRVPRSVSRALPPPAPR